MELTEPRRLYQQLASDLKSRIETGIYPVGDKLPAERLIAEEMNVSRTVVREAIIMLEVEGYVEVRKGSGIHVIASQQQNRVMTSSQLEFASFGPFELLQARQLIESNVAEFAATQVTRQDIIELMAIQEKARQEDHFRDSQWTCSFTCALRNPLKTARWRPLSKKCGCIACTIPTGSNSTSISTSAAS